MHLYNDFLRVVIQNFPESQKVPAAALGSTVSYGTLGNCMDFCGLKDQTKLLGFVVCTLVVS